MSLISREVRRQIGLFIDRKGNIETVFVGDHRALRLPPPPKNAAVPSRLSGLRLIHTHLSSEGLTRQDVTDLALRRLDLVASVSVNSAGFPENVFLAHISPPDEDERGITELPPAPYPEIDLPFDEFVASLEEELRRKADRAAVVKKKNRAILCALSLEKSAEQVAVEVAETKELSRSVGLEIADTIIQMRDKPDPKFMVGLGKLEEISLRATQLGVDLLLFQQNLTPNQSRHLADFSNIRVIDRTQLILDIFAQRAKSHDGKLQVELAQLRYNVPRMREWDTGMSRLVGGIGGMGPGETKLEIHRRRAKERMTRLEKQIDQITHDRSTKRQLRKRRDVPVVAIVGYTNAGKSTLLNSMTNADALAENRLFATLDPFSKRLRFPKDRELILTDTVGFIRDLPSDLIAAFRATLEEIGSADLILHVVDVSDDHFQNRIDVVNSILRDLGYGDLPQLLVLNKTDLIAPEIALRLAEILKGIPISAMNAETCHALLSRIEAQVWRNGS